MTDSHNQLSLKLHADNYPINQETGYGIDQIRELVRWIAQKPFNRSYKLAFVHRAEKLGAEAQNAFLKTLEEPPPHNVILLSTRNPSQLLPTVRSRCMPLSFSLFTKDRSSTDTDELRFLDNFTVAPKTVGQQDFPLIQSETDAFTLAENLSRLERATLQDYLLDWINFLAEKDPDTTANYRIIDLLITAEENLAYNTNLQLTLELTFLQMAHL